MTANWNDFKELVEKKFGSLSNFSQIVTGSFQTYKGLEALSDEEENYWRIYTLIKLAKKTDFDVAKVEISDLERLAIKARMQFITGTTDYKNANEWLIANNISHPLYSAITSGRAKRKNLAFENLWKRLGL